MDLKRQLMDAVATVYGGQRVVIDTAVGQCLAMPEYACGVTHKPVFLDENCRI